MRRLIAPNQLCWRKTYWVLRDWNTASILPSVLAPMDFDIFPRLKKELRGVRHADRRELELHVQEFVRKFDKQWYDTVYDK